MFCRRCLYPLKQLEARTCPECGTGFDPSEPRTYRQSPKHLQTFSVHVLLGAAGALVFATLIFLLVFMGVEIAGIFAAAGFIVGGMLYERHPHFIEIGILAHFLTYLAAGMFTGGLTWLVRRLCCAAPR